ncbi:hypothetical protein LCGC14_1850830 [marine sediment metagenome]|uniref:Uncharacterized protein n=1 Tax=marine sediment metagenome TaxID=412755 RepID=A0A0F9GAE2_9ZZZZ
MEEKDEIIDALSEIIRILDGNTNKALQTAKLLSPHMNTLRRLRFDIRRLMK